MLFYLLSCVIIKQIKSFKGNISDYYIEVYLCFKPYIILRLKIFQ
jgi:hypothetical protein